LPDDLLWRHRLQLFGFIPEAKGKQRQFCPPLPPVFARFGGIRCGLTQVRPRPESDGWAGEGTIDETRGHTFPPILRACFALLRGKNVLKK
jgi:hypothetical protein